MSHLVLLGDSILDNAAYVPGHPPVSDQVRSRMPAGWQVTLSARDGSVINEILEQLGSVPAGTSHLVLSAGGNDILREIGLLQAPVGTVGEALDRLAELRDRFERDYRSLLDAIGARGLPAVVCTIYNPCSADERFQRAAATALCLFNDCILQSARESGLPVIELRAICTDSADYANEIEPSATGGAKIAEAIANVVLNHAFARGKTVFYP